MCLLGLFVFRAQGRGESLKTIQYRKQKSTPEDVSLEQDG